AVWTRIRRVVFWMHLTAGLAAAVVIALMCVTGVLLMYQRQVISWTDRWGIASHPASPGARMLTVSELMERLHPESITVFAGDPGLVRVTYEGAGSLFLDAYSGATLGRESRKIRRFFSGLVAWHTQLGVRGLAGRNPYEAVRAANAVFAFLLLAGVALWIPRVWSWRHLRGVLLFRRGASGHARNF